jgi:membrane protease YdiL (CAAX protease family)
VDLISFVPFISEWLGVIAVAWLLGMSKRFQKPVVGFLYARRDGLVALSLAALIIIFSFFYQTRIRLPVFAQPLRISPAPVHDLFQALVLAAICLAPFLLALLVRQQPFRSIGWNRALITPGLQMGVAMALLTVFLRNRVMDVLGGLAAPVLGSLPIALGIALAEETIFRGYIQMRLAWWLGPWPGLVVTAILFTLWHLPAWLQALPTQTTLILAGLTFLQGLILGWVARKSGGVVAPALYRAFSIWVTLLG